MKGSRGQSRGKVGKGDGRWTWVSGPVEFSFDLLCCTEGQLNATFGTYRFFRPVPNGCSRALCGLGPLMLSEHREQLQGRTENESGWHTDTVSSPTGQQRKDQTPDRWAPVIPSGSWGSVGRFILKGMQARQRDDSARNAWHMGRRNWVWYWAYTL